MNVLFWCLCFSLAVHRVVSFDYTASPSNPLIIPGELGLAFGWSSAFVGNNILVVGARAAKVGGAWAGMVYVYRLDSLNSFVKIQDITPPDPYHGGSFGHNIISSGTTVVISAPGQWYYGAVYTYEWDGSQSKLQRSPQVVETPHKILGSSFGSGQGLFLLRNRLVVGAPGIAVNGNNQVGRVYTYSRLGAGQNWILTDTIDAPRTTPSSQFGHAVAIAGPNDEVLCVGQKPDTVYTYQWSRTSSPAKYNKIDTMTNGGFGASFSMTDRIMAVSNGSSVEMLYFDQPNWRSYHTLPGSGLGRFVRLRGDTLIVSTDRSVTVYEIKNEVHFEQKPVLGKPVLGFGFKPSLNELWLAVGDMNRGLYLYQKMQPPAFITTIRPKAAELNLAVDKRKTSSHKDPSILVVLSVVGIVIMGAVKVSWDACKNPPSRVYRIG